MVLQARQLGGNDPDIFGAFGHLQPASFSTANAYAIIGQRTKIIEAIRIGMNRVGRVLTDLS